MLEPKNVYSLIRSGKTITLRHAFWEVLTPQVFPVASPLPFHPFRQRLNNRTPDRPDADAELMGQFFP